MRASIRISKQLKERLRARKEHPRETFEQVIDRVLDDLEEMDFPFSAETKREIRQGRRDIAAGRTYTTEELRRELGLPRRSRAGNP